MTQTAFAGIAWGKLIVVLSLYLLFVLIIGQMVANWIARQSYGLGPLPKNGWSLPFPNGYYLHFTCTKWEILAHIKRRHRTADGAQDLIIKTWSVV